MIQQMKARTDWLALWQRLVLLGRAIERRSDAILQEEGLSVVQVWLLYILMNANEPMALSEISKRLGTTRSYVTQLVDRLEHEGLVQRLPDKKDRRRLHAVVTEDGKLRYRRGMRALRESESVILGELEPADREELMRVASNVVAQHHNKSVEENA